MKMNKFFMGILGALALTACSSEEVIPDQKPLPGEGEPRYMSVSIRNANPGTRAEGDGKDFEAGFSSENDVKNIRFYFFDADGKAAPVKYEGQNYYDCIAKDKNDPEEDPGQITPGNPGSDMPNVEKILNAVIVINSKTNEGDRNSIKQMVAVVNYTNLGTANRDLDDLMSIISSEENMRVGMFTDEGFVMTSSSFYDEEYGCAVEIKDTDIKSTEELAKQNPVDVYVERVVAKVRVKTNWTNTKMDAPVTVTMDGKSYQAIPLSSNINGNTTPIYTTNNGTERVYVIFKNWNLWWTAEQTYLFKNVGNWDLKWNWNDPAYHRSYWAKNPANTKLSRYPHTHADKEIITSSVTDKAYEDNYQAYSAYCLENAADDPNNDGFKLDYNPAKETSNRTLVYLSAVLVTVKDGIATPLSLAEWAGYKYTEESVIAAMFQPNQNVVYFRSDEPIKSSSGSTENPDGSTMTEGTATYKMIPLTIDNVKLVSGLGSGNANEEIENSERYLSYVNVNTEGLFDAKDGIVVQKDKLYKKEGDKFVAYEGEIEDVIDEVNNLLESIGGAKVWRDGNTYYYHDLHHLAPNSEDYNTKGRYGVVRNHIYEVEINSVFGLGTPVLTPIDGEDNEFWEDITPQQPKPDAYYLGARINILSWRVVPNNVKLEW